VIRRIRFALALALLALAGYTTGYARGAAAGLTMGRLLGAIGVILSDPERVIGLLETAD
jgi:hypothetical protein